MEMSEQDKERLFRDIQTALAECDGVHVSQEALMTFFEHAEADGDGSGSYTLLMSYQAARENPSFSQIAQAQESVLDFPGIVFSFTEETYCLDCGSDERANETDAWDWFTHVQADIENTLRGSSPLGLNLVSKWNEITNRENRSIKEAMNLLYQHNLVQKVFPSNIFTQHHGELFIYEGYQKFNWKKAFMWFYLPQIEKIETSMRLNQELNIKTTITTRTKI